MVPKNILIYQPKRAICGWGVNHSCSGVHTLAAGIVTGDSGQEMLDCLSFCHQPWESRMRENSGHGTLAKYFLHGNWEVKWMSCHPCQQAFWTSKSRNCNWNLDMWARSYSWKSYFWSYLAALPHPKYNRSFNIITLIVSKTAYPPALNIHITVTEM